MKAIRFAIFWMHLVLGCVAGLSILIMCVTGVLLAYERQITAWVDAGAVLQSPSDTSAQSSLDSILAQLNNDGQGTPAALVLHSSANAPIEAQFGHERTLYLNPWTSEIISRPSETVRTFFSGVKQIHRSFSMGSLGILMTLFVVLSGIYLWMPRVYSVASLKARLLPRSGLRGNAREWNWHHVIGIWSVVPLFVIVLSGVILSNRWASNLLFTMTGSQPPASSERHGRPSKSGQILRASNINLGGLPLYQSFDEIASIAKGQMDGWQSITIQMPAPEARLVKVSVDTGMGGRPETVSQLVISRQSGQVQSAMSFSDNNAGQKLRAWARSLHTGEQFGGVGQTIAAIASLAGAFLVWTGISMTIRRALAARKRSSDLAAKSRESEEEFLVVS